MDSESRKATPQAAQKATQADPRAEVVANILKQLDLDGNGKTSHKEALAFIAGNIKYLSELAREIAHAARCIAPSPHAQSIAHYADVIEYSAGNNAVLITAILEDKSKDKTLIVKDVLKVMK
ncbi:MULTISPECIES: hypothetical protein [unclassified Pseudomonas]|uniref:hypothetical protein n=1 Tax=Pseudomonas TaxID=286 RepID=UPI000D011D3E|nr:MULTISPECIES: hypothetical protein [unclassified Pseudomonas]PRN04854.1 hypothetical protein A0O30_12485 [Pseudomonas sp. LLC-1]PYG75896.1 hypothetical protein N428_04555 [Pseudomonas sp. RV120224-01c]PYG79561.1 hypothetical protein N436_04138 [Pseudomonas sp. RV120224-01b]